MGGAACRSPPPLPVPYSPLFLPPPPPPSCCSVFLDETTSFRDTLHVLISEGADMAIPLDATGGCWGKQARGGWAI